MSNLLVSVGMPGVERSWRSCDQQVHAVLPTAAPAPHASALGATASGIATDTATSAAFGTAAEASAATGTAVRPRYTGVRPRGTPPV